MHIYLQSCTYFMEIIRLRSNDIEKARWDGCVHYAPNGNVFGYTWFLNQVANEWEGLVEGNYESVFPLVYRQGWPMGKELYQPPLMRELGIYSVNVMSEKRIETFLTAIPEEYRKIDIMVNHTNKMNDRGEYKIVEKSNYFLHLNDTYEKIRESYSEELVESLREAEDRNLLSVSGLKPEVIADFYRKYTRETKNVDYSFHAMQRIMYNALHRGIGFGGGIMKQDKTMLAVHFTIYSHHRALRLIAVESQEGYVSGALSFMTDMFIRSHAERNLSLDFNTDKSSQGPQMFGAHPTYYYQLRKNTRVLGIL